MSETNTESIRAEAAAWISRMHGPKRSTQLEAGLRRWLAESPDHARIFERMTEAWEVATTASVGHFPRVRAVKRSSIPRGWAHAAAIVLICSAAVLLGRQWWGGPNYTTDVGEQRSVRLEDGSRIFLNSDTRISVDFDGSGRHVQLKEGGEAYFDVVTNPQRPFTVDVGDRKVAVLGTAFSVRYQRDRLTVILLDGKVRMGETLLAPGQRLTVTGEGPPQVDTPPLDTVLAWRRGEVTLDRTSLAEAVAEMNRYDKAQLVLWDPRVRELKVSGVYRIGDNAGFARALSAMYNIESSTKRGAIHLVRGHSDR